MKSWAIPLASLLFAIPGHAAKLVTVVHLDHILAHDAGHADDKIATELSSLRLRERAGTLRLVHWQAESPGRKTRAQLLRLADESAFLDLPAADILPATPPTMAAQHDILVRTIHYVRKTVPTLPDFLATRITTHFEDGPATNQGDHDLAPDRLALMSTGTLPDSQQTEPLHPMATSRIGVAYRNGQEVEDSRKAVRQQMSVNGLTTSGEFGPILSVVLGDAIRSNIVWGYWEQGSSGPVAILRYHVPQEKSHYAVVFPVGGKMAEEDPAYHGEIAVDPATGTIGRITAIADVAPPNQAIEAAITVEYGPVSIGNKTPICPLKGVALSRMPILRLWDPGVTPSAPIYQTHLNDVAFSDYHLFHADVKVVPATDP
ncbi:MAG TPA: hypothetical protein VK819_13645 [Acidobacteriaceae bacterium]|nr:hypothetical protein [Acidobacteriaceae bacterium]